MTLKEPGPIVDPRSDIHSEFLAGGGELGARMRALDWSATSLGPVSGWPQSLLTSVSTVLASPYPILLFWGPELVQLYNDAFRPIFGEMHPGTLGVPARVGLGNAFAQLEPLLNGVLSSGQALYAEDRFVPLARQAGGLKEETFFTWSYIPTRDESGRIGGLFSIASETTRQVVSNRRMALLLELSNRTVAAHSEQAVFALAEEVLAHAGADLPFALIYQLDPQRAQLVACCGIERGTDAAPQTLALSADATWPLAHLSEPLLLEGLMLRLPGGPWPEPSTSALLLPLTSAGAEARVVLVAGIGPLRPLDDDYRNFLQLLARQLSVSLAGARAYEQEQQRAEELAALDHAKTAFFSNVSHELRTPLTLILGPLEAAIGSGEPLSGHALAMVRRNALRLHKMVSSLLDFARLEAGRAQACFVATDLPALTRDLASAFHSAVLSGGLTLTVRCPPLPELVYVDPDMWEKVVLNLVSNAVKYTYHGSIEVTLDWEDQQPVLRVRDSGIGIPEAELPRVFERFYRVRSTHGRSHEGTGIGLSLVSELVKMHGGRVEVQSTLGQGSTFTVRLPRGSAHLPPEQLAPRSRSRSTSPGAGAFVEEAGRWSAEESVPLAEQTVRTHATQTELSESRILLVDDNADLREYVAGLLRRSYHNVSTYADGESALAAARAELPDLILSDVMMPKLDGHGLVRELRARASTRSVPVILLSARAGDEATVAGLESGADDYLVKPFSARELLARVHTQLEMTRVRRDVLRQELVTNELRAAVTLRDQFMTVASHELRTPLTVLLFQAEGLLRALKAGVQGGLDLDKLVQKAETVLRHSFRLKDLVEVVVDVASIDSGSLQFAYQPSDLALVARGVVTKLADEATRQAAPITLKTMPAVGRWDSFRVEQVLTALLANALKFGAGSPIEVRIEKHDSVARLFVTDQGIGIEPKDQERIFGRFERAVSERHYGGLGLGLWIARHLVEGMGGQIRVLSPSSAHAPESALRLERGTTMIVDLPSKP